MHRAEALSRAGRGITAAEAYLEARVSAPEHEKAALTRSAAEQYVLCGRTARGRELFAEGLRPLGIGMPEGSVRLVLAFLWFRTLLALHGLRFEPRTDQDKLTLERLQALRRVASGIGRLDVMRHAVFSARWMLLALRSGHSVEVARATGWELMLAAGRVVIRERAFARSAHFGRTLVEDVNDPEARTMFHLGLAFSTWTELPWRLDTRGAAAAESALAASQAHPYASSTYDEPWIQVLRAQFLLYGGRFQQAATLAQTEFERALGRGDLAGAMALGAIACQSLPALGKLAEAAGILAQVRSVRLPDELSTSEWTVYLAAIQIGLYGRRAHDVSREYEIMLKRMQGSFLGRKVLDQMSSIGMGVVATEALACSDPTRRAVLTREAIRLGKRGVSSRPAARAVARIGLACLRRDRDVAIRHLREFLVLPFVSPLCEHAARRRLGVLLGGDEGRQLVAEADRWFRGGGAVDPERFTAAWMPGMEIREERS